MTGFLAAWNEQDQEWQTYYPCCHALGWHSSDCEIARVQIATAVLGTAMLTTVLSVSNQNVPSVLNAFKKLLQQHV